jgi:Domain of unknown function (DUF4266)
MKRLTVDGWRLTARKASALSSSDGQRSTVNGQRASKLRRALALTPLLVALSACGNLEPWVKPYEREALADPIMSFDAHPVSTSYTHHVFEAREGARGALGSGGGGCGCN